MHSRIGIRSAYSLLWGTSLPSEIIQYYASQGYTIIGITDRDNLYGLHEIRQEAQLQHMQTITGSEITVQEGGSVFVWASSSKGFSRLCHMLTLQKTDDQFSVIRALHEDAQGLVVASSSPYIVSLLAHRVPTLYGAISPYSFSVVPVARKLSIPLLAIDDASGIDGDIHQILRCIATGKTVGNLHKEDQESPFKTILERSVYEKCLSSWPEAMDHTDSLASLCASMGKESSIVFPSYPGEKALEEVLRERVFCGAELRYGELADAIIDRIEYELSIIVEKGFASYFLIMDDIVRLASRSCGRGSAAASIVSYALGITNVDPIGHNLYFERFLNRARKDPPDIDVDFAWDERDAILKAVIDHFGIEHCARIANHNRFRPRSAIRECAKAYGFSDHEITQKMLRAEKELDPMWATIQKKASLIEGLPRNLSMHCGGLVITPQPISLYAPIEQSAEGYPLITWEKEGTEQAGLVKIDLLGNRSLAVIRDALSRLEELGIVIHPHTWHPQSDQETIDALAKGDTMGVFYIESPAMRQLQKKTQKGDFDHIVIHSSIIRPAANTYINTYVRRLAGEPWDPLHPRLASILDETYGILCYQEDVSKVAIALAGFTEEEADTLRKIISKKSKGKTLSTYKEKFVNGSRSNNIPQKTIDIVWEMMLSFEGYSFCKPHSASYAMVSFQSAYLRVHYPAIFMAAVISNGGGYYDAQAYISEARRMGIRVYGPDIQISNYHYYGKESSLVVGFMAIRELQKVTIETILNEREKRGLFSDLQDLKRRVKLSKEESIALVFSGALDSLSLHIPRKTQLLLLLSSPSSHQSDDQPSLFVQESLCHAERIVVHTSKKDKEEELWQEFHFLGFLREYHPLHLWAARIGTIKRIYAKQLDSYIHKKVTLIGWPITKKTILTSSGELMDFISFEDETALYETILFPQVYRTYIRYLTTKSPLRIHGTVIIDHGAVSVEISSLSPL